MDLFDDVCRTGTSQVNANKSKMIIFESDGRSKCKIRLHCEELEIADEFKYMGVKFSKDGSGKASD